VFVFACTMTTLTQGHNHTIFHALFDSRRIIVCMQLSSLLCTCVDTANTQWSASGFEPSNGTQAPQCSWWWCVALLVSLQIHG
jgi:hypothetical protein